jgi:hypothetical protein
LHSCTGAAQKRFCVKTPETVAPSARRITSKSLRLALRTPASAWPSSMPGTGFNSAATGRGRLTAMFALLRCVFSGVQARRP